MKKAFSFSEILLALVIVGILFLILTPIMTKISPKTDNVMVRKAYSTAEKVIYNMINDDSAYPDIDLGFANETATTKSSGYNKFCYYFIENMNTVDTDIANCHAEASDGIVWNITPSFVNGSGDPIEDFSTTISATTPNGTTFDILVRYDGKIKVTDEEIIKILKKSTSLN